MCEAAAVIRRCTRLAARACVRGGRLACAMFNPTPAVPASSLHLLSSRRRRETEPTASALLQPLTGRAQIVRHAQLLERVRHLTCSGSPVRSESLSDGWARRPWRVSRRSWGAVAGEAFHRPRTQIKQVCLDGYPSGTRDLCGRQQAVATRLIACYISLIGHNMCKHGLRLDHELCSAIVRLPTMLKLFRGEASAG
jgi:hypothetical protein